MTREEQRLEDARTQGVAWRRWGPYLSERQWGTVREDYSENGDAWSYLSHDQARSRAYRWGEDGLAGLSDDKQRLCFALCLWNGRDPIVKERLFGLSNAEGNHGEDVKEYYFYLDSTPTHAYMKYLYKYPQAAFPYGQLVATNKARSRNEAEYELLAAADGVIAASHPELGERFLHCERPHELLFTDNETNHQRLWGNPNPVPYVKDGINDFIVHGRTEAVNPEKTGTKASPRWLLEVGPGQSAVVRLRLTPDAPGTAGAPFGAAFDDLFAERLREADEFYDVITPDTATPDAAAVMRQALAGMLWTKQYYYFDVDRWLEEHGAHPAQPVRRSNVRNREWFHMVNDDIISMPDKREYPWFAAWDLAFHTVALACADIDFAKHQLEMMLREMYLHPSGQIPAYEWNFGDVNPPVHAWATYFLYNMEKERRGEGDLAFLKGSFNKLLMNFSWWVNRKDPSGNNVFEGGFLGLDNIGVFDRSAPLPTGGRLEQADGTAWMALFCQNMLDIARELALHDPTYEEMVVKFTQHFLWIASAMDRIGEHRDEMWDEQDGFFYDLLRLPDGSAQRLRVRSMVGLLPLCASSVFPGDGDQRSPQVMERLRAFLKQHPEVAATIHPPDRQGLGGRRLLAIFDERKLRRVLAYLLDEKEFLGPHGNRALSKVHEANPFVFRVRDEEYRVRYLPGESDNAMFGGNSNWRGPVWFPVNLLLVRSLLQFYLYYGDDFRVECPTGSGRQMTLFEVAREISNRLIGTFLRGPDGRRPVYGGARKFQQDPHWRDLILFYEYFHGDNGAGIGASHQTGWTGTVARLIQAFGFLDPAAIVAGKQLRPLQIAYRDR